MKYAKPSDAILEKILELDSKLNDYKELIEYFGGVPDESIIRSQALAKKILRELLNNFLKLK